MKKATNICPFKNRLHGHIFINNFWKIRCASLVCSLLFVYDRVTSNYGLCLPGSNYFKCVLFLWKMAQEKLLILSLPQCLQRISKGLKDAFLFFLLELEMGWRLKRNRYSIVSKWKSKCCSCLTVDCLTACC